MSDSSSIFSSSTSLEDSAVKFKFSETKSSSLSKWIITDYLKEHRKAVQLVEVPLATANLVASALESTSVYLESVQKNEVFASNKLQSITLNEAVQAADQLCEQVKNEFGIPGLVVSVTVDGIPAYQKGFGYADIENHIPCKSNTVMRIASISKSITMAVVAKLWQEGNLSFDKPVQDYVPEFPEKHFNGEKAEITLRHLLSHLSGIRHYDKASAFVKTSVETPSTVSVPDSSESKKQDAIVKNGYGNQEFLMNSYFSSVSKSLALFKDDELFHKPGMKYHYTTHGWTLVSAVVEKVVKISFPAYMKTFFHEMGLKNTYLDENKPIIYNRAKYYIRNMSGRLENAPHVDNSYKWAGGGFLSTCDDLVKFGNAMLYSYQNSNGFLHRDTVKMIWTPVPNTNLASDKDGKYGMGWGVILSQNNYPFCKSNQFYVSHSGGAAGASSILLILPRADEAVTGDKPVRGVVVSMIANLQNVGLHRTALEIAKVFESVTD